MPQEKLDAEASLRKLGKRLREGWTKAHPVADKSLETVKDAVRKQWDQEQAARETPARQSPSKSREREPEEPDPGR